MALALSKKKNQHLPFVGPVPSMLFQILNFRILKGLSQKWACPEHWQGPVPRAGLSQAAKFCDDFVDDVPKVRKKSWKWF